MADSFTANLNLRKPEVGHANDTWGGTAGLNSDLDILDGIFLATGLGTAVGLHVGAAQVLNVEGGITLKDPTDTTKVGVLDRSLITTATTRTLSFPDEDGIIATRNFVQTRLPTGAVISGYFGPTPPPGFVMADGRTIGDATSGATNRANADCQTLFTLFWNLGFTPSGGRGASAAADWAAHKTMALPNHSGRTMAGRDNLSGTALGILSGFTAVGVTGGTQDDPAQGVGVSGGISGTASGSLSVSVFGSTSVSTGDTRGMQPGGDFANGPSHTHTVSSTGGASGSLTVGGSFSGSGVTAAATNIQPTIAVDVVIAL